MLTRRFDPALWARWTATFVAFPVAGVAARAVAGRIDSPGAALTGGLAAGLTLGAIQAIASRGDTAERTRWAAATSVGMACGLALGAAAVDYATDVRSLVLMGAINGAAVGVAQAAVMPATAGPRFGWIGATPLLWALGWLATSQVIVDADRQHATFGSSGALVATALDGLILAIRPVNAQEAAISPATTRQQSQRRTAG